MSSVREFISELKRKTKKEHPSVGLFGLGKCNSHIARLLNGGGCDITLRSDPPVSDEILRGLEPYRLYEGADATGEITEDTLVFSPSVRRDRPEFIEAAGRGVTFTSDAEIFFSDCPRDVIAVTGSDGKSTVTDMTAAILNRSPTSPRAYPSGNFGLPFSALPPDRGYAVAELSSFNLTYLEPRSERAVVTNITPNHLNWHSSLWEYENAKLGILTYTKKAILPADGGALEAWAARRGCFVLFSDRYSLRELMNRANARHYVNLRGDLIELDGHPYLDVRKMIRREPHNILNAMAAVGLTLGLVPRDAVCDALYGYRGLAHRCQTVGIWRGVEYINSSIDTSPARTSATLSGLGKRVHLILGGRDKGLPMDPALSAIGRYAERIYIYGECREIYARALGESPLTRDIPAELHATLPSAIRAAADGARTGGTVLLSPAATAFGEFRDFTHRAEAFSRIVKEINAP